MALRPKKSALTDEQRAIIETKAKRVVVYAGAGSDRTSTLCLRVQHLLKRGVLPSETLILSSSDKVVHELRKRLDPDLKVKIVTFHSFGRWLAQEDMKLIGTHLATVTPTEGRRLLRSAIKSVPRLKKYIWRESGIDLGSKDARARLFKFFEVTKGDAYLEELQVEGGEFSDYEPVLDELRTLRQEYNRAMTEAGVIDYPHMLQRGEQALDVIRLPYKYLLIDTGQDMTEAQVNLMMKMVEQIQNVMVFGDLQPAIYSFMVDPLNTLEAVFGAQTKAMSLSLSHQLTKETAKLASTILGDNGN